MDGLHDSISVRHPSVIGVDKIAVRQMRNVGYCATAAREAQRIGIRRRPHVGLREALELERGIRASHSHSRRPVFFDHCQPVSRPRHNVSDRRVNRRRDPIDPQVAD